MRKIPAATENDGQSAATRQIALADFGELAVTSDDADMILTQACSAVGDAFGTGLALVMELQAGGPKFQVRAGAGWKPGVVGWLTAAATEEAAEFHVLTTGEPAVSPDVGADARFVYPDFLAENGVRSAASVRIVGPRGKTPFGVLQVASRQPRSYCELDVGLLRSYANLIATAVDRLGVSTAARARDEQLRLALEAAGFGCWGFELASGVATSTPHTMKILGYDEPAPALTMAAFVARLASADRKKVVGAFRKAVENGAETRVQCRVHHVGDGQVRWIELCGRAMGAGGDAPATHLLGVIGDITPQKTVEAMLRDDNEELEDRIAQRTRQLTEANTRLEREATEREVIEEALRQSSKMEAVGQLTGGLAHGFNNLLAGISGSLELIRTRVAEGRIGELERYIQNALASAERAGALTHRLLAFSRRQTLDPKITDLNDMIGSMRELLQRTVMPSIHVETRLTGELWSTLCDRPQLEIALLNLVMNARDAMPEGGTLRIETLNVTFPDRHGRGGFLPSKKIPSGQYVALYVTDTGTGMATSTLQRAFDPFFTTKPLGQGAGLGLSMTQGFVEQSGGHVDVQTKLGQGTTIAIYLPKHLPINVIKVETQTIPQSPAESAVVLVVEDEPTVRMVVVDVLADSGFATLVAEDGRSGLDIAKTDGRIDLLVTDVGLPGGMNGRQLADAARKRRPELKVLFITGFAENALGAHAVLDQNTQVMIKPFKMDALLTRVSSMIAG